LTVLTTSSEILTDNDRKKMGVIRNGQLSKFDVCAKVTK
jgi:hypothetical protein